MNAATNSAPAVELDEGRKKWIAPSLTRMCAGAAELEANPDLDGTGDRS